MQFLDFKGLSEFLKGLFGKFSEIGHKHTTSDITDYVVDSSLSSTSTNPIQNKVINAEFDAVSEAMGALEAAIDEKLDTSTASSTYETKEDAQLKYDTITDAKADWNQNDENAIDYVKNRTHYKETVYKEIIPETTAFISEGYLEFDDDYTFEEGKTYYVTFNGVQYKCVAYYNEDWEAYLIGNGSIYDMDGGNNEPFIFENYDDGFTCLSIEETGTYTFKIEGYVDIFHKIDAEYLPELPQATNDELGVVRITDVTRTNFNVQVGITTFNEVDSFNNEMRYSNREFTIGVTKYSSGLYVTKNYRAMSSMGIWHNTAENTKYAQTTVIGDGQVYQMKLIFRGSNNYKLSEIKFTPVSQLEIASSTTDSTKTFGISVNDDKRIAIVNKDDETDIAEVALKSDLKNIDLSSYETTENAQTKYDNAIAHSDANLETAKNYTDTAVSSKADASHNHDNRYYTEPEVDELLEDKSDTTHNHDSAYDTKGSADTALATAKEYTNSVASGKADSSHIHTIANVTNLQSSLDAKVSTSRTINGKALTGNITLSASDVGADASGSANSALASSKSYTDSKVSGLASTTVVDNKVGIHNTSTSAHSDIRDLITGLTTRLNALADSDDTTLDQMSEIVAYIKANKTLIESITTSKINVSDIVNNLTTNSTSKVLSAAQGVAIKALIDALETELDSHTHDGRYYTESEIDTKLSGKANTSHGTHVSYSSTAPVMDGTASVGTASTVARSDHKHPTDTSRASQSSLDSHTGNTTSHITSTERTNWNAAKTHADSAHAPSNAQANQNAFSNIKVGSTTISADTTTDTLELVGSNVTLTPDTTNDKVTIGITKSNITTALGYTPPTTDTKYTHPTTAGNKHIPAGGSSGQILRWSADGTAVWGNDNNTTYSVATTSASGLMSATDKTNLNAIVAEKDLYAKIVESSTEPTNADFWLKPY